MGSGSGKGKERGLDVGEEMDRNGFIHRVYMGTGAHNGFLESIGKGQRVTRDGENQKKKRKKEGKKKEANFLLFLGRVFLWNLV